jgi:hypothetical protein
VSRGTTEPSTEAPTENLDPVNVSEDAPEELEEVEAPAETLESEAEEPAEEAPEVETNEDDSDLLYYEIDGEEVSAKQLQEWKNDGLMQADYTRKTQELADSRKDFEAKEQELSTKQSELNDKLAQVNAMIEEETPSAETLAEWREYEPEKLLDYQDKQAKRKELLGSYKQESAPSFDVEAERSKLWNANPTWLDNGKQTQAFTDDMNSIQSYAAESGYNNEDFAGFRAQDFQTMLDAAKYKALNKKNVALEKKVRKAPAITKPRQAAVSATADLDKAYKDFKNNPDDIAKAVRYRKLKRQIN